IFSQRQVEDVTDTNVNREAEPMRLDRKFYRDRRDRLPPLDRLLSISPFDANWLRIFKAEGPLGRVEIKQRLTLLTPQFAKVEAQDYDWIAYFLTRAFDPA